MTRIRRLDALEMARLTAAGDSSKKHKPRECLNCNTTFNPKRSNQLYCSVRCRDTIERVENVRAVEVITGRICPWCGNKLPEHKQANAIFCSDKCRALAFKARPCIYCGEIANTRDHFIPQAFVKRIEDLGWAKRDDLIVPACQECNSTAGSEVFRTITEKRKYIHDCYKKKYRKLLDMPSWTENEINELGPLLRNHVQHGNVAQDIIKARLRWPKIL